MSKGCHYFPGWVSAGDLFLFYDYLLFYYFVFHFYFYFSFLVQIPRDLTFQGILLHLHHEKRDYCTRYYFPLDWNLFDQNCFKKNLFVIHIRHSVLTWNFTALLWHSKPHSPFVHVRSSRSVFTNVENCRACSSSCFNGGE